MADVIRQGWLPPKLIIKRSERFLRSCGLCWVSARLLWCCIARCVGLRLIIVTSGAMSRWCPASAPERVSFTLHATLHAELVMSGSWGLFLYILSLS